MDNGDAFSEVFAADSELSCPPGLSQDVEIKLCPRALIAKLPVAEHSRSHWSILISSVVAIAATPLLGYVPHICLARLLLQIPCPGCGITHSLLAVEHFNFAAAWRSNPAGLGVGAGISYQVFSGPIAIFVPTVGENVGKISQLISVTVLVWVIGIWISRLI
jgi:hypothetical protein